MVLRKIHDESIWIDGMYMITREAIRCINCLWSFGPILDQKSIKVKDIMEKIGATLYEKELTLNTIRNPVV